MVDFDNTEKQVNGVARTINILQTLSNEEKINLETLSKLTDIPKATLIRFLSSLINLGYVSRDDSDQYSLTLKMFSVGSKALVHIDLINTVRPFAKNLCKTFGETVHMGVKDGEDGAIYVLKEESKYTLRMYSRIGKVIPLYCTAIGKIFLSELSDAEFNRYIENNPLKPFTKNSLRTPDALTKELKIIKAEGWSMDREEHEENVVCIACPIFDYTGQVISALSVSWPIFRFNKDEADNYIKLLKDTTNSISKILGYKA